MMGNKTLARRQQFDNYKRKWSLTDYSFYTHSYGGWSSTNGYLYVVYNGIDYISFRLSSHSNIGVSIEKDVGKKIFKIQSLTTLLRKVDRPETRIFWHDSAQGYEVESFDDLKATLLIRKLARV